MPQTGKHPGIVVHKGHGAYACGGITHPHPGAPLPGGVVPCGRELSLELFTLADIDQPHRGACCGFQCIVHRIVGLGQNAVHTHHAVTQPESGFLGGVYGAFGRVQIGKAHDECAL